MIPQWITDIHGKTTHISVVGCGIYGWVDISLYKIPIREGDLIGKHPHEKLTLDSDHMWLNNDTAVQLGDTAFKKSQGGIRTYRNTKSPYMGEVAEAIWPKKTVEKKRLPGNKIYATELTLP